jgi:8-oxo-dGTP pyrophosphatase MutT (NUDIX family)
VARSELTILLTARTAHLSSHAGQIAFPGGKVETFDTGPLAAAIREAREEIDLDDAFIDPVGYLSPYRTGTGFIITPSVALVRPGFKLTANPDEVAEVFEVPFEFLMDEANHQIHSRAYGGAERRFYAMPYGERYIWGATAGIIRTLYRRLFEI